VLLFVVAGCVTITLKPLRFCVAVVSSALSIIRKE